MAQDLTALLDQGFTVMLYKGRMDDLDDVEPGPYRARLAMFPWLDDVNVLVGSGESREQALADMLSASDEVVATCR